MTTQNYNNLIDTLIEDLDENVLEVSEWDEGDLGIITDIKFNNPVSDTVSLVSIHTDYDEAVFLYIRDWESKVEWRHQLAAVDVNELYELILTDVKERPVKSRSEIGK